MKKPRCIVKDMITKNKELPRYRLRGGKRRSTCCDALLVSKYGDSYCSNCNNQITWGD